MKRPKSPPIDPLLRLISSGSPADQQAALELYKARLSVPISALTDPKGRYLHWEELKHRPLPDGVADHETWWFALKQSRGGGYELKNFPSINSKTFRFNLNETIQSQLHHFDQRLGGRIEMSQQITNPRLRDRYIVNSLIDEAITSSQMEGASTSHRIAKSMLREERQPTTKSERMIFNNYRAMNFVRSIPKDQDLNESLLLELHKYVTNGTLADPELEGRFKNSDDTAVREKATHRVLHHPPPVAELALYMKHFYELANFKNSVNDFIHPIIQASLLHFMLAYIHPFEDGNGRTARALFYWWMIRNDYWMTEFISISSIIKKEQAQYGKSFLYVETDDNDLSYFLHYHLAVIGKALVALEGHLREKAFEAETLETALNNVKWRTTLNHRQLALLSSAIKTPDEIYTVASHAKAHRITKQTARSDLKALSKYKLLEERRLGSSATFRAAKQLPKLLETR